MGGYDHDRGRRAQARGNDTLSSIKHPNQRQPRRQFRPFVPLYPGLCRVAPGLKPRMQTALNRALYQLISAGSKGDPNAFLNDGYVSLDHSSSLPFTAQDEDYRPGIQLNHRETGAVDLRGKDVLEVGGGRGGGAVWIMRCCKPRNMTGIDAASQAIAFCQRFHQIKGLSFQTGDAENLPFPPNAFDVVVNVESSQSYPSAPRMSSDPRNSTRYASKAQSDTRLSGSSLSYQENSWG